jgi:hypothetical protein
VLADTGAAPRRCADLAVALTRTVIGLENDPTDPSTAPHHLGELVRTTVAGLTRD